jgi:alpha-N-arabinofuranosidase
MRHTRQLGLVAAILGPSFGLGMAARWWAPPTSEARFDWFAYEGNDSVYRNADVGPTRYTNPILAGFYPDPSMIRVGENYYLVTSSFAYFRTPIFRSKDLVHWTQLTSSIVRRNSSSIAPASLAACLRVDSLSRRHVLRGLHARRCRRQLIVTAKDPAGPWSEPIWLPGSATSTRRSFRRRRPSVHGQQRAAGRQTAV